MAGPDPDMDGRLVHLEDPNVRARYAYDQAGKKKAWQLYDVRDGKAMADISQGGTYKTDQDWSCPLKDQAAARFCPLFLPTIRRGKTDKDQGIRPEIYYVNGIRVGLHEFLVSLAVIEHFTKKVVLGVYNATAGILVDLVQSFSDKMKSGDPLLLGLTAAASYQALVAAAQPNMIRPDAAAVAVALNAQLLLPNPAAETLMRLLWARLCVGEDVQLWAHSQGGAIASSALARLAARLASRPDPPIPGASPFPCEEKEVGLARCKCSRAPKRDEPFPVPRAVGLEALGRVHVTSFAAASGNWIPGPRYTHYVHINDLTPVFFGWGKYGASDPDYGDKNPRIRRFFGTRGHFTTIDQIGLANAQPELGLGGLLVPMISINDGKHRMKLGQYLSVHMDMYHSLEETYLDYLFPGHGD